MSDEQKKAVQAEIENKINQAQSLIAECEKLADQHKLHFDWDLAYGMGGWYNGADGEWAASSQSC